MAISEKDLDDLDAAHRRTTKGSWVPFPLTNGYHDVRVQESDGIWESIGCTDESSDNGSFCCLAHEQVPALIAEVRRLREENDEWHRISERWGRASGKQYGKLAAIRDLANARLADTAHMASIQEAETLWKIVRATEGE